MRHDAGPAPELIETGRVHGAARTGPQRLPRFLNGGGTRRKRQIARDAAFVVVEHDARAPQRFDDLDAERSDLHVGTFCRGAPRPIKTMLAPIRLHDAECTIENAAMRINRHTDAEVIGTVGCVAVEPRAVVDVAVARRRMGDRLRRLVNGVVVQLVQHVLFLLEMSRTVDLSRKKSPRDCSRGLSKFNRNAVYGCAGPQSVRRRTTRRFWARPSLVSLVAMG